MQTSALLVLGCLLPLLQAQETAAPLAIRQGRVVDVCGEAVPAAAITVFSRGAVGARTATDAQGIYVLRWRAQPGDEVRVTARGKAEVREPAGSGTTVANVMLEDGCRLHGTVTDASGAPVVGASVLVLAGLFSAETASGAGGTFAFPAMPLRPAIVRVFAGATCVERTLALCGDTVCDVSVPRASRGGRIVRVSGLPADATASAFVELTSFDMVLQPGRGRVPLRADGTAELTPTETSLVRIVAPGFLAEPPGRLIDPGCYETLEFAVARVALPRHATMIKGRVLDADDRPIGGLRLVAADRSYCEVGTAVAGADGAFLLPVRLPRDAFCRLGLELRDWWLDAEPMRITRGCCWIDTTADPGFQFTLRVLRAGAFRAEVRGRKGEGFVFADLFVATAEQPRVPFVIAATDQRGAVEVRGLPPGSYQLTATSHDGEIACATVRLGAGAMEEIGEWRYVPSGAVEGRVLDRQGRGVPGLELFLGSPGLGADAVEVVEGRLDFRLVTDRDGRFRCRGLAVGEWSVAATKDRDVAGGFFDVVAGTATPIELRLDR